MPMLTGKAPIYPGIKENENLPNKQEHPIIPCCYVTDHRNTEKFRRYLSSPTPEGGSSRGSSYVVKDKTRVKEGRKGHLPPTLARIFGENVYRLGVKESPSSILYCLGLASGKYFTSDEITKLRSKLAEMVGTTGGDLPGGVWEN